MAHPNSTEAQLSLQIAALTDVMAQSLSFANALVFEDDPRLDLRSKEIANAVKLGQTTAGVAQALATLQRGNDFNINVRRSTGHVTHRRLEDNTSVEEIDWNQPPPFTKEELATLSWDDVRERVAAQTEERARIRAAHGLPPYPNEPNRKLGEPTALEG